MTSPDPAFERDVAQFWSFLFEIVLDAEKRMASLLAEHGLTTPQFYVLKTLTEHSGRYAIGAIARAHGLTSATMTGLVKRLEAMRLVEREQSKQDRRSVYVMLTPAGVERFNAVQVDLLKQLEALLSLLSVEERGDLLRYLGRYAAMVSLGE
jgi:DNA-binding MarR family transcriptional regulator